MSVSLALLAFAAQQIVIPLGRPKPIERLPAPIASAGPAFARTCMGSDDWDKPAPPVRIHGNSYYVGTCGISAILITGRDGHVLIDSGTEAGAELVAANVRRLGFKLSDVRFLLHSHEHHDHVGGMARLQALTDARLVASVAAAPVFRSGRPAPGDPQGALLKPFARVPVARTIVDGGTLRLGGIQLTAYATPGHTAGALSWQWVSCEGAVCRTLVFADSLSPVSGDAYRFTDHPAGVAAFRASIAKVRALTCDILLTPHPSASNLARRFAGTSPLMNDQGCIDHAAALERRLDERLAKEGAAR